jgi:putative transposase
LEFNGEADHVHLLLSLFVNNLKTVTSRYIRKELGSELKQYYWNKPVFWSRSYCIISCGGAPLSVIKQYIEQQEAPHSPPAKRFRFAQSEALWQEHGGANLVVVKT